MSIQTVLVVCLGVLASLGDCRPTSKARDVASDNIPDVIACTAGTEEVACGAETTCSAGPIKVDYEGKEVDVTFCENIYTLKV